MIELIQPGRRMGVINVPASKSDAQRAILVAALVRIHLGYIIMALVMM